MTSVLSAPSAPSALDDEAVVVLLHQRLGHRHDAGEQRGDVEPLGEHLHASRFDLGQIEHVVDQSEQVPAAHVDLLEILGEGRLAQLRGFLLEHLAVADDGIERRAQLVRHAGEEAGLLPSGLGERDVRVLEPRERRARARWRSA